MNFIEGLTREWLEADGLGGFASGTASGIRTRRYHALLLTADPAPARRFVLANGCEAFVETTSGSHALTSQRYHPDVIHPDGAFRVVKFSCDPWPRREYELPDGTRIVEELFVPHGLSACAITWRALSGRGPLRLKLRLFLSGRDYHALQSENTTFDFTPARKGGALQWAPYSGVPSVHVFANGAYRHEPLWYRNFLYSEEAARGLDCTEDLASPGEFSWDLARGPAVLVLAGGPAGEVLSGEAEGIYASLRQRESARRAELDPLDRAALSYFVRRGEGLTVIAGYPWFTDWGRDTFIALRGLALARGRFDLALAVLETWAEAASRGMLPNRFPDGDAPAEYNSVDASLWFAVALHELEVALAVRGQALLLDAARRLHGTLAGIIDAYVNGTRYGIRADGDGLLIAGDGRHALTWMDAAPQGRPVTPRAGKAVEVQALWLNALRIAGRYDVRRLELYHRARASFERRFWNAERDMLYDVVDADGVPGKVDPACRPNQIIAAGGLPVAVLSCERARAVVAAVESRLWTPLGLRTLEPGAPGYTPRYEGGPEARDRAYHQGTAWPWLLGPFVEAWLRVRRFSSAAFHEARGRFLAPLEEHLETAGLGHVSEIADAEPPHTPRGCPFQAWSLGEYLRLKALLEGSGERRSGGLGRAGKPAALSRQAEERI